LDFLCLQQPIEAEDESEASTSEEISNMYVFEGKDYSKEPTAADQQTFQQLADGKQIDLPAQ
jgi:hypothetical protein